jgi:hypothetical protein
MQAVAGPDCSVKGLPGLFVPWSRPPIRCESGAKGSLRTGTIPLGVVLSSLEVPGGARSSNCGPPVLRSPTRRGPLRARL